MKRRTFLKTVGSAAGAAALGGPKVVAQSQTSKPDQKRIPKGVAKHGKTDTYGLSSISSPVAGTPFSSLPVRLPGWFPDGTDWNRTKQQRVFPEEVIGITKVGLQASKVDLNFDTGRSAQWILGHPIPKPLTNEKSLTTLVRTLADIVRRYNACLYRLRRVHFHWRYRNSNPGEVIWPLPNPPFDPGYPDPTSPNFNTTVSKAEQDWTGVNNQLDSALDDASNPGYPKNAPKIALLAADMIAVNGYIVSMRVVVQPAHKAGETTKEVGGSSSHVSISSPFSSSSP